MRRIPLVRALFAALVTFVAAAPAAAVQSDLTIFIDFDNDPATGCNDFASGFMGYDQRVVTTVDTTTGPNAAMVTQIEGFDCSNTQVFFDGTDHPVGIGNGDLPGFNVVETYWPIPASLPPPPLHPCQNEQQRRCIRIGAFAQNANGGSDTLFTTDGTPTGSPIQFFILGSVAEIPTLGQWGLLVLLLLLAGAATLKLRRQPRRALLTVALVLCAGGAAFAVLGDLDGNTLDEWPIGFRVAHDPTATNDGDDIASLYARSDVPATRVYFRIDASLVFNSNPTITSSATPTAPENQTLAVDVQSTDPDGDTEGAGLTYSITGGADQALFSINPNTGVLTFNSAPNFEAPADAGGNNVYDVQVTVTDSTTATGVQNIQVTVTSVNEAPSITSSATPSVAENQTSVIDVQSTDPDGETEGAGLTYSITGGADAALFSIVPATGVLTFNSAPDFEAPADAGANNVYDVQVTVTDAGTLTGVQNLQVTVTNAAEGPTITSSSTPSAPENQTAVIDVQSTDPEGDTEGAGLTYSITGGADAALFSIVPATGVLTFNAPPNFEAPSDAGANNVYDVQVTVTDSSTQTDVQNLQVTVTNVNEAPTITSSATPSVVENQTTVVDAQSTDPDGETEGAGLTYSITGGADAALFSIVPTTGVLTFNSAPDFEAPADSGANNVYDVQVTVTDAGTLTDVQNIQVTVTDITEPPTITSSSTRERAGEPDRGHRRAVDRSGRRHRRRRADLLDHRRCRCGAVLDRRRRRASSPSTARRTSRLRPTPAPTTSTTCR